LNVAASQELVLWQSSQVFADGMCVAGFPLAVEPLWHEKQFPVMPTWLKLDTIQLVVEWQSSQLFELGT